MFESLRNWLGAIRVSPLLDGEPDTTNGDGTSGAASPETLHEIQVTQTELLFEMDRGGTIRTMVAFLALTYFAPSEHTPLAWSALGLYCAISLLYYRLHKAFQTSTTWQSDPEKWTRRLTVMTIASGLAWGFGGVTWFSPTNPESQAFAAMIIMGVASASVVSRTLHQPAMIGFALCATVPLLLALLSAATTISFTFAGLGVLLILALVQGGKSLNRSQIDSIALRHRIGSLAEDRAKADLARHAAEAGSRAKSEFLAMMSHEVRTPLNGILGMAQVLQFSELEDQQRASVEAIVESGNSLLNILNDILDISKMEAGRLELQHTDFDVLAEVERATQLFTQNARTKKLDLKVQTNEDAFLWANGDPHRTRQVLANLIGNAVKFTDCGSITVTAGELRSGLHPDGIAEGVPDNCVVISVADSGIGIPPKLQKQLFKPFVQGDQSNTRQFGGTGLGLNICKRLVALMDGTVGVTSTEGEGSVFWFSLPPEKEQGGELENQRLSTG